MARQPKRITKAPVKLPASSARQAPQNIGQNRNVQMRNNSRLNQNRVTFQGGLTRNQGIAPPQQMPQPQNINQPNAAPMNCPTGLEPGLNEAGEQTCVPSRPSAASGNVPVNMPTPKGGGSSY